MDKFDLSEAAPRQPPSQDLREIQKEVITWAESQFPGRTRASIMAKFIEEVNELINKPNDGLEMADVLIMLIDIANYHGVNLGEATAIKMEINRNRDWSKRKRP